MIKGIDEHERKYGIDLSDLLGRRFTIDQTPLPTTPASRILDRLEGERRDKQFRISYQRRNAFAMPQRNRKSPKNTVR